MYTKMVAYCPDVATLKSTYGTFLYLLEIITFINLITMTSKRAHYSIFFIVITKPKTREKGRKGGDSSRENRR